MWSFFPSPLDCWRRLYRVEHSCVQRLFSWHVSAFEPCCFKCFSSRISPLREFKVDLNVWGEDNDRRICWLLFSSPLGQKHHYPKQKIPAWQKPSHYTHTSIQAISVSSGILIPKFEKHVEPCGTSKTSLQALTFSRKNIQLSPARSQGEWIPLERRRTSLSGDQEPLIFEPMNVG